MNIRLSLCYFIHSSHTEQSVFLLPEYEYEKGMMKEKKRNNGGGERTIIMYNAYIHSVHVCQAEKKDEQTSTNEAG